jgi:hypothetical protein
MTHNPLNGFIPLLNIFSGFEPQEMRHYAMAIAPIPDND